MASASDKNENRNVATNIDTHEDRARAMQINGYEKSRAARADHVLMNRVSTPYCRSTRRSILLISTLTIWVDRSPEQVNSNYFESESKSIESHSPGLSTPR
jgi:hypothetical protein